MFSKCGVILRIRLYYFFTARPFLPKLFLSIFIPIKYDRKIKNKNKNTEAVNFAMALKFSSISIITTNAKKNPNSNIFDASTLLKLFLSPKRALLFLMFKTSKLMLIRRRTRIWCIQRGWRHKRVRPRFITQSLRSQKEKYD